MIQDPSKIANHISQWLKNYSDNSRTNGFIIGISGGVDSAVTSTLCALTEKKVICLNMPIHQKKDQFDRAADHIKWLQNKFANVSCLEIDLSNSFEQLKSVLPLDSKNHALAMANTRARLRMSTLYAVGQANGLLVAGTGNKIEDFGVGFFTKYGDGGVDISPIADLTKTEVFQIGKYLSVLSSILTAAPTDGLWEDNRTDEEQLGASYPELEWAMEVVNEKGVDQNGKISITSNDLQKYSIKEQRVIQIYLKFHNLNKHKMSSIPVCTIPPELKK